MAYHARDFEEDELASIKAHIYAAPYTPLVVDGSEEPGGNVLLALRCMDHKLTKTNKDKVFAVFALRLKPRTSATSACNVVGHDYVVKLGSGEEERILACMLLHPTTAQARRDLVDMFKCNVSFTNYTMLTCSMTHKMAIRVRLPSSPLYSCHLNYTLKSGKCLTPTS